VMKAFKPPVLAAGADCVAPGRSSSRGSGASRALSGRACAPRAKASATRPTDDDGEQGSSSGSDSSCAESDEGSDGGPRRQRNAPSTSGAARMGHGPQQPAARSVSGPRKWSLELMRTSSERPTASGGAMQDGAPRPINAPFKVRMPDALYLQCESRLTVCMGIP
jgi:hypothetical protein